MSTSDPAAAVAAQQGVSVVAILTAIGSAVAVFSIQMGFFELIRNKLARIYIPKTYLVPERERTRPPPRKLLAWVKSIFTYRDREVIQKCGLDAYFFLRYLQTLLIIFVPLACLILPILLPLNYVGGAGTDFVYPGGRKSNITGIDVMAWGNISPAQTQRYWGHLIMAIVVVVWVCWVFFAELRVYIRVRQDYLTSAEHRLRASATTVLVSSIPQKWLSEKALMGLYDVFPGGIRNIWINRNYDELLNKVHERDKILRQLESAETQLIKICKKAQLKQAKKEEKEVAKKAGVKQMTKEEKQQRQNNEDMEAQRRAQGEGVSSGDPHQVHRTVEEAVDNEEWNDREREPERGIFKIPVIGAVSQGLASGLGAVGNQITKAGQTIVGGALNVTKDIDNELAANNGFAPVETPPPPPPKPESYPFQSTGVRRVDTKSERYDVQPRNGTAKPPNPPIQHVHPTHSEPTQSPETSPHGHDRTISQSSAHQANARFGGDGTNEGENSSDNWIRFWRGPAVGYPSPKPHGYEENEFPLDQVDGVPMPRNSTSDHALKRRQMRPTTMDNLKYVFQTLLGHKGNDLPPPEYPPSFNPEYKEDVPGGALWEKYIKRSDRPTHRIPNYGWVPGFLPGLPFLTKKVDSIYWCREQLARLNVEIEEDQQHPERYPMMNSAFIQFNHQVAAHMASQAVSHHIPKQMTPRTVEISPTDVIWDNMSIKWWEEWFRTLLVVGIVSGMTILWAIPVGGTALLSNLPALIARLPWLDFLIKNDVIRKTLSALGGVLPALALAILMAIVPMIFYMLATKQGVQTGNMRELTVQNYLFFFNFFQIFLVVSVFTGALSSIQDIATDPTKIPDTLARKLPTAANYFFSYMILQALGNSSGALLQYVTLVLWFVLPKLFDSTAREKWTRATTLSVVNWGSYFPLYTTFACIALVYSVVAPVILIFAIITFSLYWIANRYCMLYIYRVGQDTGGLLYPRAINQTFTGLYFMEICMIGLFFLVRDQNGNVTCTPQAIIMIAVTVCTVLYQVLLNQSFSPLFQHLPITLEDDAVLRDEAFGRMQAAKFGNHDDEDEIMEDSNRRQSNNIRDEEDIEMKQLVRSATKPETREYNRFDPRKGMLSASTWATRGTTAIRNKTIDRSKSRDAHGNIRRHRRPHRDLEAQQKIANSLFGGIDDEIEDLTPDERDSLVNHAFKHEALRARRPTVWIPRDDLGISDEEVRRTEEFSAGNIWISNEGTALDSKVRVVYGKNPPDFTHVDLIKL